jgi:Holliday junction resolvasome RuvABC endonuclease subunit
MVDAVVLGLDQGVTLTGWCVGDGSSTPAVGAWRFDDLAADDLAALGGRYLAQLRALNLAHGPTHCIYEAPFIDRYRDHVLSLRRRFGVDMLLEVFCAEQGIICEEAPFGALKKELGGSPKATKDDVVAGALRLGVALPKTKADGREDAADAAAAWLVGIRCYARQRLPNIDKRLYGRRAGGLI